MESAQEQLLYGTRVCEHGTRLGTPDGIDFMCHRCEDGYDIKVVCDTCNATLWLRDDQEIPSCEPHKFRAEIASSIYETRLCKIAAGTYDQAWRQLILDAIETWRDTPKRIHKTYDDLY